MWTFILIAAALVIIGKMTGWVHFTNTGEGFSFFQVTLFGIGVTVSKPVRPVPRPPHPDGDQDKG